MARIRSIKPEACTSEKLGAVSSDAERLFWRLQTHCDDHGRCEDSPRVIYGACCPTIDAWTPALVDDLLWELADIGLVRRYVDDTGTRHLLDVPNWADHQHPQKPRASKHGAFEAGTIRVRDTYGMPTGKVRACSGSRSGEGEGEGDAPVPPRVNLGVDPVNTSEPTQQLRPAPEPRSPAHPTPRADIVNAAIDIEAERRLAEAPDPTNGQATPQARLPKIRNAVEHEHRAALTEAAFRNPSWTPERLAMTLLPVQRQTVPAAESTIVRLATRTSPDYPTPAIDVELEDDEDTEPVAPGDFASMRARAGLIREPQTESEPA